MSLLNVACIDKVGVCSQLYLTYVNSAPDKREFKVDVKVDITETVCYNAVSQQYALWINHNPAGQV